MKIKLFSFFSGCGLLDLGMEEAGFDIAMVSEKYQPFLDAYKYSREKMQMPKPEYGYFNDEEEFFTVTILQLDDPESQTIRFDTEDADFVQPININSSLGLMISKEGETQIVWQNSQTYFSVVSELPSEIVIRIAEGIK